MSTRFVPTWEMIVINVPAEKPKSSNQSKTANGSQLFFLPRLLHTCGRNQLRPVPSSVYGRSSWIQMYRSTMDKNFEKRSVKQVLDRYDNVTEILQHLNAALKATGRIPNEAIGVLQNARLAYESELDELIVALEATVAFIEHGGTFKDDDHYLHDNNRFLDWDAHHGCTLDNLMNTNVRIRFQD